MKSLTRSLPVAFQLTVVFCLWTALAIPGTASATEHPAKSSSASAIQDKKYSLRQVAGSYSFGNGLDLNFELEITPDGRFNYEQASYEGLMAQASGRASVRGRTVVLAPLAATPEAWPPGMGLELTPVSWGDRLYLVPDKDMVSFVNAVNRGSEPVEQVSRGTFFLREGDVDRHADGRPDVPSRYASLLLSKPLKGRVLAADAGGMWRVDLGSRNGVQPGMELCAWSPDDKQCVTVTVCKVEDCCCTVQNRKTSTSPLLNWKVCSRLRNE